MNADRQAMGAALTTLAPAKINLDLRLRGVRADGYHLVSTRLQSIALADRLTLERHDSPFALTCAEAGVPTDATNLAWRGAAAMAAHLGVALDGWRLSLEKAVPAEAGLGGGSADAVAAARLVAAAAGATLTADELASVVRPLGADVAFFAWGGTVQGEGVGDVLTPLEDEAAATLVLVRPDFGVSTRDAYRWHDEDLTEDPGATSGRANDLEAPVVRRHPVIGAIVSGLEAAGARLAAMSGSGSACFGLFDPSRADIDDALGALRADWPEGTRVWMSRLLSRESYRAATAVVAVPSGGSVEGVF